MYPQKKLSLFNKSSFFTDIISSSVTRFVVISISFITSVLIARWLLPEGKGIMTTIMVVPGLTISLATLGLRQSITYYTGKELAIRQDIISVIIFLWIATSIFAIILTSISFILLDLTRHGWLVLILALITIPLEIYAAYFRGLFMGMRRVLQINFIDIIKVVTQFLLVLIVVGYMNMGVQGAIFALIGALSIQIICVNRWARGIGSFNLRFVKNLPKKLIIKGIGYAAALFIFQLNYRVDILILQHYVQPADVGLYAVGVSLSELIWQLPTVLGFVVFAHSASTKDVKGFSKKVWSMLLRIMLLAVLGGACLAIAAPYFVPLMYGQLYAPSIPVIWILLPGIVMSVAFKILNSDLAGRGKPWIAFKVYSFALIANIYLNFLWIPQYGIKGAALASSVTYSLASILFALIYKRFIDSH